LVIDRVIWGHKPNKVGPKRLTISFKLAVSVKEVDSTLSNTKPLPMQILYSSATYFLQNYVGNY